MTKRGEEEERINQRVPFHYSCNHLSTYLLATLTTKKAITLLRL